MQDKRQGFADCFTVSNMLRAADECYKGVGWKRQPQLFMNRALTNCAKLLREVEDGTYRPTATRPFTISERGKTRRVKPVNFRDRVVQRCFCENVLVPAVESFVSAVPWPYVRLRACQKARRGVSCGRMGSAVRLFWLLRQY